MKTVNQITLDSNPSDAPGCLKIVSDDGRDILVQTDWEFPAIASTFGWDKSECSPEDPEYYTADWRLDPELQTEERPVFLAFEKQCNCKHEKTDGTVNCPDCGMTASHFIAAAREWLDNNDGAQAEDPGYFES